MNDYLLFHESSCKWKYEMNESEGNENDDMTPLGGKYNMLKVKQ